MVTSLFKTKESMAKLTLGVGTRIAFPVNLPAKSGITLATAATAPVEVITIFNGAPLPLLSPLWKLSIKFWSLVYEWTVSIWPPLIPYLSLTTWRTGTIALVVHEAAETI